MAKKIKRILFNATYFDSGLPKWEAGKHYPVSEDTQRQVTAGIAEEIEVAADKAVAMDTQLTIDVAADADVKAATDTADAQA